MEKTPVDPLSAGADPGDEDGTSTGKRTWVKFSSEDGPTAEATEGAEPSPTNAKAGLAGDHTAPSDSDQSGHPAVIETSVAIVPTVQIQSPSRAQPAAVATASGTRSNSASASPVKSPPHVNSTSASTSKDKASTFINLSQLDNVELRNSQPSLNTAAGTSSGGEASNGIRRAGFTNGDEIVSIVPQNARWPWVTPAVFRPELVPEELMNESLTLTVEEYVHIMEMLTTDFRFNLYIICYKRLLASWLATAFFVLLIILFSSVGGVTLFALGITWLIINAAAVFLCMYIKIKINKGLERCMARVNKLLLKHKLIVGVDDRGRLSCHKVQLCFIYYDATECIKRLTQLVGASTDPTSLQRHLDSTGVDIVITGTNCRRIPQSQDGQRLFLRYVQRWSKDFLRRRLDWTPEGAENPASPRHLHSALCVCQYTEEYLRHKPVSSTENSCSGWLPCWQRS